MRARLALLVLLGAVLASVPPAVALDPVAPTPAAAGHWLVASDGGVFAFGGAPFYGSTGGVRLNKPVVGMTATPSGRGYWLVASDGGIFSFGDAAFFGSTGGVVLNRPVVGMAATPGGAGYWLVASDGGIFTFGDAGFFGSAGGQVLKAPIVGMAPTPTGRGYWLVGSDGAVFPFGDAGKFGSLADVRLARPVVGLAPTPSGRGYWLAAADGGVFSFGDAPFAGSAGGHPLNAPLVGLAAAPRGAGYWLTAADGGVFAYGDAPYGGSLGGLKLSKPVVGAAARPVILEPEVGVFFYPWWGTLSHDGYWNHWHQADHDPPADVGANFYPARGLYSSHDADTLKAQAKEMAAAGVDQVISSWWGRLSFEDQRLEVVADAVKGAGLEFVIHLEPYDNRSPRRLESDLEYLRRFGVRIVYLYNIDDHPASEWAEVIAEFPDMVFYGQSGNLTSMLNGSFANFAAEAGFDGIYTYDGIRFGASELARACASARRLRLACAPSVAPGFDGTRATSIRKVVHPAGGERYDDMWRWAMAAGADVVTITSWNEWHEGTQIEPATPHCFPDYCSPGYEGIYGRYGEDAETAYMDRTREWADRFRTTRAP
ncbi:MAG: hypothetical protein ACRDZ3_17600 [Acidimicrobiia bacterium]